jgi:hypothetical protein
MNHWNVPHTMIIRQLDEITRRLHQGDKVFIQREGYTILEISLPSVLVAKTLPAAEENIRQRLQSQSDHWTHLKFTHPYYRRSPTSGPLAKGNWTQTPPFEDYWRLVQDVLGEKANEAKAREKYETEFGG